MNVPPKACNELVDYENEYWGPVAIAVDKIFQSSPSGWPSFEKLYSVVYKAVCSGFAEQMHKDLINMCSNHLEEVDQSLNERRTVHYQQHDDETVCYILSFHDALEDYLKAVPQITPIFSYLDRSYVGSRLNTSLQNELFDLFKTFVADKRMDGIMGKVQNLLSRPFVVSPSVLSSLFIRLHCLDRGDYAKAYPELFSRYIPGVLPPMQLSDLEGHMIETRELQNNLRFGLLSGGDSGTRGCKRSGDDESYGPSVAAAVQNVPHLYN